VATTLTPWLFASGHDIDRYPNMSLQYRLQVADASGATVVDSGCPPRLETQLPRLAPLARWRMWQWSAGTSRRS
jgi:hypothetical protein